MHFDTIAWAICERVTISFWYDDGIRYVEPHCLGYGSRDQSLLRGYQIGGHSRSGVPEGWKLFRLDRARGPVNSGGRFGGPRPGYKPNDSAMRGGIHTALGLHLE